MTEQESNKRKRGDMDEIKASQPRLESIVKKTKYGNVNGVLCGILPIKEFEFVFYFLALCGNVMKKSMVNELMAASETQCLSSRNEYLVKDNRHLQSEVEVLNERIRMYQEQLFELEREYHSVTHENDELRMKGLCFKVSPVVKVLDNLKKGLKVKADENTLPSEEE